MPAAVVLAHYGGAPEALTIALPVAIFVGFMALEKRARRKERERADADGEPAESRTSAEGRRASGASSPVRRSGTQPADEDA